MHHTIDIECSAPINVDTFFIFLLTMSNDINYYAIESK